MKNLYENQNALVATGVPACRKHITGRDACATNDFAQNCHWRRSLFFGRVWGSFAIQAGALGDV
jgi:hypothetical protein